MRTLLFGEAFGSVKLVRRIFEVGEQLNVNKFIGLGNLLFNSDSIFELLESFDREDCVCTLGEMERVIAFDPEPKTLMYSKFKADALESIFSLPEFQKIRSIVKEWPRTVQVRSALCFNPMLYGVRAYFEPTFNSIYDELLSKAFSKSKLIIVPGVDQFTWSMDERRDVVTDDRQITLGHQGLICIGQINSRIRPDSGDFVLVNEKGDIEFKRLKDFD